MLASNFVRRVSARKIQTPVSSIQSSKHSKPATLAHYPSPTSLSSIPGSASNNRIMALR